MKGVNTILPKFIQSKQILEHNELKCEIFYKNTLTLQLEANFRASMIAAFLSLSVSKANV
jgi:hypothetical protein